ncbi:MAG: hypothetical protein ACYC8T_29950 [Myxococcaceae bacterium]
MRAAAALLLLLPIACGSGKAAAPDKQPVLPPSLADKKALLPKVAELPCFECHPLAAYQEGPRFPHEADTHQDLGHCHRCHRSSGHHGTTVDEAPCQECHEAIPNREPPSPAPDAGP